jgi:hypothetical protein
VSVIAGDFTGLDIHTSLLQYGIHYGCTKFMTKSQHKYSKFESHTYITVCNVRKVNSLQEQLASVIVTFTGLDKHTNLLRILPILCTLRLFLFLKDISKTPCFFLSMGQSLLEWNI